jgi:hypothetical protein
MLRDFLIMLNDETAEKLDRLKKSVVPFKEWRARHVAAQAVPDDDGVVVQGDFRPELHVAGADREARDVAQELGRVLADKGLYWRGGRAWIYSARERRLLEMDSRKFVTWIQDHVRCLDFVGRGKNRRLATVTMTDTAAMQVLSSVHFAQELPEIKRVMPVPVPVRREDGRVELLQTGYDKASGVLVLGDAKVDRWDVGRSKEYLLEFMNDFAFEPGRKAQMACNMIAGQIAVFGDLLVETQAPRPAWIFTGNAEGSGKTTASRVVLVPVYGPMRITPPPDKIGEEIKKLLLSAVMAAEPYIVFDNWRGKIGGPALEAFATSTVWSDRVLGKSEKISLDKSTMLFITANDATLQPDMRRRCIAVELFIEEARAEDRRVTKALDESVILHERSNILSALWGLVANWVDKGCPDGKSTNLSFPAWGRVIGGIMEAADLLPPSIALETSRGGDEDLSDFDAMLRTLLEDPPVIDGFVLVEREKAHITAGALMGYARHMGYFPGLLDVEEPSADRDKRKERAIFGKICHRFTGRVLPSGWKFAVSDHESRANRHYIISR